ncbi:MAG: T9SS type A sorting domain-containing protein [bacterium]
MLLVAAGSAFSVSKLGFLDPYWIIRHLRYHLYAGSPADTLLCWNILNSRSGYFPLIGDTLGLDMCWSLCDPWATQLLANPNVKLASEWYPDSTWKYVSAQQEVYDAGAGGYFAAPLPSVGEFVADSDSGGVRYVVRSLHNSHTAGDILPQTLLGWGWLGGYRMYNFRYLPPYDGTDTLFFKMVFRWDSASTGSSLAQIALTPIDTFEMTCSNAQASYRRYDSLTFALGYRWNNIGLSLKVNWPGFHDLYIDRIEIYDRAFRHLFYDDDWPTKLNTVTTNLVRYRDFAGDALYNFRIDEPNPRTYKAFKRVYDAYHSTPHEIAVLLNPHVLDGEFFDYVIPDTLIFFTYVLGGDSFQSRRPMPPNWEPLYTYYASHSSDVAYVDSFPNPYGCNYWCRIHSLQHEWDKLIGSPDHGAEYKWGLYKMREEATTAMRPWAVFLIAGQEVDPLDRTVRKISHRDPTPNEMYCMAWLALSYGPEGIGWYRVAGHMWGDSLRGNATPPCCDTSRVERTHGLLDWMFNDSTYASGPQDFPLGASYRPTERFYAAQGIHAMLDTIGPVLDRLQWIESGASRAFEMNDTIPVHFPFGAYLHHALCEKETADSVWVSEPRDSTYVQYAGFMDPSAMQDFWILTVNRRCLPGEKRRVHFKLRNATDTTYVVHYLLADTSFPKSVSAQDSSISLHVDLSPGHGELIHIKIEGPHINARPPTLDYGDVHTDSTADLAITVSDTGYWDLIITGMDFAWGQAFELTPAPQWPDTIPAQDSAVYLLRFAPSDTGVFADTLRIFHTAGDPIDISLSGHGVREAISVSPDWLNFGLARVEHADTLDLFVANPGTADLMVQNMIPSDSAFDVFLPAGFLQSPDGASDGIARASKHIGVTKTASTKSSDKRSRSLGHLDEVSFIVEPEDSQLVHVSFTPIEEMVYSETLRVLSSLPDVEVALSGIGAAPHMAVEPLAFDFGDSHVDSMDHMMVVVSDTGGWDLLITNMEFTTGEAFRLVPAPSYPDTIAAQDSKDYEVHFAPPDTGMFVDTLILHHDAGEPVHTIFQGRGIQEDLRVSPEILDFGLTRVDSSDTKDFYVTNPGTADLLVRDIVSSDSAFEVSLPPNSTDNLNSGIGFVKRSTQMSVIGKMPAEKFFGGARTLSGTLDEISFVVSPGDSQHVFVTFRPAQERDHTAILTIRSSLPDVELSAMGIGGAPHIMVNPPELNFGDVHVDSTTNLSFAVTDTGDWNLLITDMRFAMERVFELYPAPQYPDTVLAHQSLHYPVRVAPTDVGRLLDTLIIYHDAGEPVLLSCQGTAILLEITLSPDSLNFGSQWLNTVSQDTFWIINSGTILLEIDSTVSRSEGFFLALTDPLMIVPTDSLPITLSFLPLDTLKFAAPVTVYSNAGAPTISVYGRGIWTDLKADPDIIDFGKITVLESRDTTVLLTSIGNTYVSSILTSCTMGKAFAIIQEPADSIPAYGHTEVKLSFVSQNAGFFQDTLVITHHVGTPIRVPLSAEVAGDEDNASVPVPSDYYLHHNYPNPFNPATTFEFGVPKTSHVNIRVHDILGRQVDILVDGMVQAGHHQVIWNCRRCTSGVYLVVMSGDGFNIVRKAMLLR